MYMGNKEMKKLTLDDLISKKEEFKNKKNKEVKIFVDELDGYIIAKKPGRKEILAAREMGADGDCFLVYDSVLEPNFKSEELQKAFEISSPMDIIREIFLEGTITNIAQILIESAGYKEGTVKIVDEIKN